MSNASNTEQKPRTVSVVRGFVVYVGDDHHFNALINCYPDLTTTASQFHLINSSTQFHETTVRSHDHDQTTEH